MNDFAARDDTQSRSRLRRVAHEQGEPVPRFDHGPHARKELRDTWGWSMATLRYELAHQQAPVVSTWGPGRCGHSARGSGFCAGCLQAEIDRRAREALHGEGR